MKELASSWARTGRIILHNLLDRKHEPESAYLNRLLEPGGVCLHIGASDGPSETTAFFDEPWRDYYCVPGARVQELALVA